MSIPCVLTWLERSEDDVSLDSSGKAGEPTQDMRTQYCIPEQPSSCRQTRRRPSKEAVPLEVLKTHTFNIRRWPGQVHFYLDTLPVPGIHFQMPEFSFGGYL